MLGDGGSGARTGALWHCSLSAWASAAPSLPKTPPADTAGALGALDAWASKRSPEPAASASPELALGAFSSRKSLESPARSPRKAAPTSPLAAFMAKVFGMI